MTTNTQELQMPNSGRMEEVEMMTLLKEIKSNQERQGVKLDQIDTHLTGGPEFKNGILYRVAQTENVIAEREKQEERRRAWTVGIGVAAVSAIVIALLPTIFKLLSTTHPG